MYTTCSLYIDLIKSIILLPILAISLILYLIYILFYPGKLLFEYISEFYKEFAIKYLSQEELNAINETIE